MPETVGSPRARTGGDAWEQWVNKLLEELGTVGEQDRQQLLDVTQHAEGQGTAWLRGSSLKRLILDLNNAPCRSCLAWLYRLLGPGQVLVLRFLTPFGLVVVIIEEGAALPWIWLR
jgi:hypothetical protein